MSEGVWPDISGSVTPKVVPPKPWEVGLPIPLGDEIFPGIDLRRAKQKLLQTMSDELNIEPDEAKELFENIRGSLQWGLSDRQTVEIVSRDIPGRRPLGRSLRLFRNRPVTEGETLFAIATWVSPENLDKRAPYRKAVRAKNSPLGRLTGGTPVTSALKAILFPAFEASVLLDVVKGRYDVRPRLDAIERLVIDALDQNYAKTPDFRSVRHWLGMLSLSPDELTAQGVRDQKLEGDAEFIRTNFPDLAGDGADIVHDLRGGTRSTLEYYAKKVRETAGVAAVRRAIRTQRATDTILNEIAHDAQLNALRALLEVDLLVQGASRGEMSGLSASAFKFNPFLRDSLHYIELLKPGRPLPDEGGFITREYARVRRGELVGRFAIKGFREIADHICFSDGSLEGVMSDTGSSIRAIDQGKRGIYLVYRDNRAFLVDVSSEQQFSTARAELMRRTIADFDLEADS